MSRVKYEPSAFADPAHTAPYTGPYATVWTRLDQAQRAGPIPVVSLAHRLQRVRARELSAERRRGRAALACALLLAGHPAAPRAQEARFVPPALGAVREYAGRLFGVDCAKWTVTRVADDGAAGAECAGHSLSLDASGNPQAAIGADGRTLVEFKPAAPGLRFPLTVGAHWRQGYTAFTAFNNLVWDGEANCRVEAFEPVQVPAGQFDAFRIECRDQWKVGPKFGYTHVTRWYAPAVATVVRQIHREDPAHWNFELVANAAAPPAAPPPPAPSTRIEALPTPGPRPQYDPAAPDILDPDEY